MHPDTADTSSPDPIPGDGSILFPTIFTLASEGLGRRAREARAALTKHPVTH